jgi:hypothetical protein
MRLDDHEIATAGEVEDRREDVTGVGALIDQRPRRAGSDPFRRPPQRDDRAGPGIAAEPEPPQEERPRDCEGDQRLAGD